jgi:hypothetical protein
MFRLDGGRRSTPTLPRLPSHTTASISITRRYCSLARLFLECLTSQSSIHWQGERRKRPAIGGEANGWGTKGPDDLFIYIYGSHL